MIAAMIQWVKLPSELPCERTEFGNISDIKTQITAPCDMAKKAIKQTRYKITKWLPEPILLNADAVNARKTNMPMAPTISNVFLPTLSIIDMPINVKRRLARPIYTGCRKESFWLKPAISKIRGA